MMLTTTVYFTGDTVRYHGLTLDAVREMIAELECPADIRHERNWCGDLAIRVAFTTEDDDIGNAASEELVRCVQRTRIPHAVGYAFSVR